MLNTYLNFVYGGKSKIMILQYPSTRSVEISSPGNLFLLLILKKTVQLTISVSRSNGFSKSLRLKTLLKTIFQYNLMDLFKVLWILYKSVYPALLRSLLESHKSTHMLLLYVNHLLLINTMVFLIVKKADFSFTFLSFKRNLFEIIATCNTYDRLFCSIILWSCRLLRGNMYRQHLLSRILTRPRLLLQTGIMHLSPLLSNSFHHQLLLRGPARRVWRMLQL